MQLAIADPPYLGRARRWYGDGRGHAAGRGRADEHVEAPRWDTVEAHEELVDELEQRYDGWAIAMAPDSLSVYLAVAPAEARVAVWSRGNAVPTGSRVRALWEPALVRVPDARAAHGAGAGVDDVLTAGIRPGGFAGRKPEQWTHWVLTMLGYDPAVDDVEDLFPGSGAVSDAIATFTTVVPRGRRRLADPVQAQQVRRTARASTARKAAVLAALRAGGSIRSVAADARVSTTTVQKWKRDAAREGL